MFAGPAICILLKKAQVSCLRNSNYLREDNNSTCRVFRRDVCFFLSSFVKLSFARVRFEVSYVELLYFGRFKGTVYSTKTGISLREHFMPDLEMLVSLLNWKAYFKAHNAIFGLFTVIVSGNIVVGRQRLVLYRFYTWHIRA